MDITDINANFGLVSAHAEDAGLHTALLQTLKKIDATPRQLLHSIIQNGVRRGELGLVEETTKWAVEQGIGVLVVAAMRDHPDHAAIAWVGRQAAKTTGLDLLELTPGLTTLPSPQPQNSRSTEQPPMPSDYAVPILTHTPELHATYLWTPRLEKKPQALITVSAP